MSGLPEVALLVVRGAPCVELGIFDGNEWWTNSEHIAEADVLDKRPLLLINPEDATQVEALAKAFDNAEQSGPLPEQAMTMRALRLRAALRSLAQPATPEPTGLGAVVREHTGVEWVRLECMEPGGPSWVQKRGSLFQSFDRFAQPVTVLSAGWSE